jgi:uncharacterized protein (DUF427 family)
MRAVWQGVVIAESHDTVVVEGNHYFPVESLVWDYFEISESRTTCSWKGIANYFDVVVGDERNVDAAWYYPDPIDEAERIRGRVAFWRGVTVDDEAAP